MSYIPGATKRLDPETMIQQLDRRGRPLWNMPEPIRTVERVQIARLVARRPDGRPQRLTQRVPDTFPVYRGVDAKYARWMRAQMRRMQAGKRYYLGCTAVWPAEEQVGALDFPELPTESELKMMQAKAQMAEGAKDAE